MYLIILYLPFFRECFVFLPRPPTAKVVQLAALSLVAPVLVTAAQADHTLLQRYRRALPSAASRQAGFSELVSERS